ncbi:thioredoxin reductase [Flavobacterium suaedae]|uniref:Thioredoxin reductase n=1 Tax=Flavobacterium suaedae TaxID=1767027 RepID=A0ABQ1JKM8_9FLAO|nr:NAD(P)/FAD-dependent oxidoreductase [Flavobacterium suaedae]GGB68673.1 thioredoxin reductase [Flavobacterium suaedae]
MSAQKIYDVVIIGGSYAGLSAALALGRSLRNVLVIDNDNPCNKSAPEAHNFLTNDGVTPCEIRDKGREQIKQYKTVDFATDTVTDVVKTENNHFKILSEKSKPVKCKKVLFATGITDTLPSIQGFEACWGISILHCPYCHGYEVANKKLGVLGNGDMGYEMAKTICHWAGELTLFTNGASTLAPEEVLLLNEHNITIIENEITNIVHDNGYITELQFEDTEPEKLDALFTQLPFVQQCDIPEKLGCEFTDNGFIKVSKTMETSVPGIYAAGDCLTLFRSVANAVAAGNKAGATINKQFIAEAFELPEVKII